MKCLDTDLLVAILRGEHEAERIGFELDRSEEKNATTAISASELSYGANHSQRRAENVEKMSTLLQRLDVLPLDLLASERAGELLANLALHGKAIEYRDAMIAGIVIESGATLITRNTNHFKRIPKLKLEAW